MTDNKQTFAEKARISNEFELSERVPLKFYSSKLNQIVDLLEINKETALRLVDATGDQYLKLKRQPAKEEQKKDK